ncbi:hypothetical protein KIKIMORA_02550 [Brevundimonas phage vB_BpoS-Kikimora]|uniref:Uncharacterized protein n=1 Tax=Brevundimonas phage vB_BpoS-Kikimora TaxID=2948601 RepID=A0A9E7SL42_9CAUD|nr:hypothetical protein KIKIMORA_02550 [Brevundimonas phage vB_BpoS-Kikimora]
MSIIKGTATVNPPPLAPLKATWTVDVKAKTSTASVLGGEAVITRREDGRFGAVFTLEMTDDKGVKTGEITQRLRLDDCTSLDVAQQRCETLIRETLHKTNPDLLAKQIALETAETVAKAAPDPF